MKSIFPAYKPYFCHMFSEYVQESDFNEFLNYV